MTTEISFSSYKRAENNVRNALSDGDKFIPIDFFYMVVVEITKPPPQELLKEIAKDALTMKLCEIERLPFVVYHLDETKVVLAFSCLSEGEKHNFQGSHQLISSYYSSVFSIRTGIITTCRIVELPTRNSVLLYFTLLSSGRHRAAIETKIGCENSGRSIYELTILSTKEKQIGNILEPHVKWGTFYKLSSIDNVETLSEAINASELPKYENFLFKCYKNVHKAAK